LLGGGEEQVNAVFLKGGEGKMPELNFIGTTSLMYDLLGRALAAQLAKALPSETTPPTPLRHNLKKVMLRLTKAMLS
jgi:hypothetical protein